MNRISKLEQFLRSSAMNRYDVLEVARDYGTPTIIYSRNAIEERIEKVLKAFSKTGIEVHYACKANFNPHILGIFKESGLGLDAANLNELLLGLSVGFDIDKISVSPNFSDAGSLREIVNSGAYVNFDSLSQFRKVMHLRPEHVSFRINPGFGSGEFKEIVTGGHGSKFGVSPDEALEGYRIAKEYGVKNFGIHMMAGSNNLNPEFFRKSSEEIFNIAKRISNACKISFDKIDIGGGLGVAYKEDQKELDLEEAASGICENFLELKERKEFGETRLVIEPGRYLVAEAGMLISKVTEIKKTEETFVGLDVSMNTMVRIPLYGAEHPIVFISEDDKSREDSSFNVVGQACENSDFLGRNIKDKLPEEGDVAVILNCGAYVTSMSSYYNLLPTPMEILINRGKKEVIKKRLDLDQILFEYGFSF